MAVALIETHVLLWMLDGSLSRRSSTAARRLAETIAAHEIDDRILRALGGPGVW